MWQLGSELYNTATVHRCTYIMCTHLRKGKDKNNDANRKRNGREWIYIYTLILTKPSIYLKNLIPSTITYRTYTKHDVHSASNMHAVALFRLFVSLWRIARRASSILVYLYICAHAHERFSASVIAAPADRRIV